MLGYVFLLTGLVFLYVCGAKFRSPIIGTLDKKQHPFQFLYHAIGYWLHKVRYFGKDSSKRKVELYQTLYPGMDAKHLFYTETCRRISIIYILICLTASVCIILKTKNQVLEQSHFHITKPPIGMAALSQKIYIKIKDEKDEKMKTETELNLEIQPRKYTMTELAKLTTEAETYIRDEVKGENVSLDEVYKPLRLVDKIPDNPYKVSWTIVEPEYINEDGTINNKEIESEVITTVMACIAYKETESYIEIPVKIQPYKWTWAERAVEDYKNMLKELEQKNEEYESYDLPSNVGNLKVTYEVKREDKAKTMVFSTILGCISIWLFWGEQVKKMKKQRDDQCLLAYPSLVYKMTLLLGAGMTLNGAWKRIIQDYIRERGDDAKKCQYVYEEMILTWHEIENGIAEIEAFTQFGKKMKLRPYLRLSSLITQNMKKGTKGFLSQLEAEAREAQEERKQMARRLGEEAGTKLLIPMSIMLLIVLMIVMVPAFMSLSKGGM